MSAAAGESSAINDVTAVVPPLPLFLRHGIDLHPALEALRTEIPMLPLPDRLVGPMARHLMHSAVAVDHIWCKFDRMIFADQCHARSAGAAPTAARLVPNGRPGTLSTRLFAVARKSCPAPFRVPVAPFVWSLQDLMSFIVFSHLA